MRTIAHIISSTLPTVLSTVEQDMTNVTCHATFADVKAVARTRLAPNLSTIFHSYVSIICIMSCT